MTNIENERLTDFKKVLTFHLVTNIKEKFDSNYNLYFFAPKLWRWSDSYYRLNNEYKLFYYTNLFNQTALSAHQVQSIFGTYPETKKWLPYKNIIDSDPDIKVFKNGTIMYDGKRYQVKKRYQLPYEFIKNIFENKELLDKVLDVNSDYYSNRQRRLIFTQLKKQKHYHYKRKILREITDSVIEDILVKEILKDFED